MQDLKEMLHGNSSCEYGICKLHSSLPETGGKLRALTAFPPVK
jgi:hypothetical protein